MSMEWSPAPAEIRRSPRRMPILLQRPVPSHVDWREAGWVTQVKMQSLPATIAYEPRYRAANCTGYSCLPKGDEEALMAAVSHVGPISVAIDASRLTFIFYHSGVYKACPLVLQEW
ncbi:cathepsin J-like [Engraulis encrasicolus]|uniref:cathepsin J-like n=1 Tax=Engraulis encrasicolus TaxID=184585 RepID=UPI002FD5792B